MASTLRELAAAARVDVNSGEKHQTVLASMVVVCAERRVCVPTSRAQKKDFGSSVARAEE